MIGHWLTVIGSVGMYVEIMRVGFRSMETLMRYAITGRA